MEAVPYPTESRYSPEMLAYYRYRYSVKCQDEEYREKVRQWAREYRARKKAREEEARIAAGLPPKPIGRPRKVRPATEASEAASECPSEAA